MLLLLLAYAPYALWTEREVKHAPGVLVAEEPTQEMYKNSEPALKIKGAEVIPLASYSIHARILSKEIYRFAPYSDIVPVDLAVGWGPMSDSAILRQLSIWQSNRFYYWSVKQSPIPVDQIVSHSANMHMFSLEHWVRKKLKNLRVGQIVTLKGDLIQINFASGSKWRSSLVRTDTGNGACELMWVKDVIVDP